MTHATLTTQADTAAVLASTDERVYSLAELMEHLEWDPFVRRCLGFARFCLCRHGSAAGRHELQPGDCVQEAIRLTLEGRRHFECGTKSQFFVFVCGVIRSLVSHDGEKTRRHATESIIDDAVEERALEEIRESQLASSHDFESALLFRDDLEHFFNTLDPELAAYARLRRDGIHSTAEEYANVLSLKVQDIRNMDRRLRRRREEWLNRPRKAQREPMYEQRQYPLTTK